MPIEFSCECGSRFRVDDAQAGKRARCGACRKVVRVPSASVVRAAEVVEVVVATAVEEPQPPPVPGGLPAGRSSATHFGASVPTQGDDLFDFNRPVGDRRMEREIEYVQKLTDSSASNPGRLRISHLKHWLSFPLWPTVWAGSLLAALLLALFVHQVFFALAVPLAILKWLYWWVQRMKFVSGCTNPALVVAVDPPLVAVFTDLSKGGNYTNWHYVKFIEQPLGSMTDGPPQLWQRLATVATYHNGENSLHWDDFWPTVVNCVTWNKSDINRVFATLTPTDWTQLEAGLRQVPQPFAVGLYKVEIDAPVRRSPVTAAEVAGKLSDYLRHGAEKRCWLATHGIPPYLLQSAMASISRGAVAGEVLGLLLAEGDSRASTGLLFTSGGVLFRFADGQSGGFRWNEMAGAGNTIDGLEVLLKTGARLRWGKQLGKFADNVEAVLDAIAKAP